MATTCRAEVLNVLATPISLQKSVERRDVESLRGVFDIETLAEACSYLSEITREFENQSIGELKTKASPLANIEKRQSVGLNLVASKRHLLEKIDERAELRENLDSEEIPVTRNHSAVLNDARNSREISQLVSDLSKREAFHKCFEELEARLIESVRSLRTDTYENAVKSLLSTVASGKFKVPSTIRGTRRAQQDSSTEDLSDDFSETEVSSTKIDDNNGKVREADVSTSVLTGSSKQSQVSTLIDDVSTYELSPTRAADADLAPKQAIFPPDTAKPPTTDDDDDKRKEKFALSHESHETSQNMTCSNTSLDLIHKTSTFTSDRDVFEKRMEALRKRLGDDASDATKRLRAKSAEWLDSECIPNEQVKQVLNFVGDE